MFSSVETGMCKHFGIICDGWYKKEVVFVIFIQGDIFVGLFNVSSSDLLHSGRSSYIQTDRGSYSGSDSLLPLSPPHAVRRNIAANIRYDFLLILANFSAGYFFFEDSFLNSARAFFMSARNVSSLCRLAKAPETSTLEASTSLCQWNPAITRLCPHS